MKYTGGCHCGAVRFEADIDLTSVLSCNCSYCSKKGVLLTFILAEKFTLIDGANAQTEYLFNKKVIQHLFCRTCGVQSFSRGSDKSGAQTVAINVRCLDNINLDSLTIAHFDGKNWS